VGTWCNNGNDGKKISSFLNWEPKKGLKKRESVEKRQKKKKIRKKKEQEKKGSINLGLKKKIFFSKIKYLIIILVQNKFG